MKNYNKIFTHNPIWNKKFFIGKPTGLEIVGHQTLTPKVLLLINFYSTLGRDYLVAKRGQGPWSS